MVHVKTEIPVNVQPLELAKGGSILNGVTQSSFYYHVMNK